MANKSREEWKTYQKVFDNFTYRTVFKLSSQGHFDELESVICPGKEAVVLSARKGEEKVAVKIHRLETSGFSKMYSYISLDPRYLNLKNRARQVIFAWTEREYRNLLIARKARVSAPMPIAHNSNVLVMEFIGNKKPSPLVKDSHPKDPKAFVDTCIEFVKRLVKAGYVHGDLSQYNILNHNEKPVFIDFSHMVALNVPNSKELLERDIKNLCIFFNKIGVEKEASKILSHIQ